MTRKASIDSKYAVSFRETHSSPRNWKMKLATALLTVAILNGVSAVLNNCNVAGGDVFEASFATLKAGAAFDCSTLDSACLNSILNESDIKNKTANHLGFGFKFLYEHCDGSNAQKTFNAGLGLTDMIMNKYFTAHCADITEADNKKTCIQEIFTAFKSGRDGENCKILDSLKTVFDTYSLQIVDSKCVNNMKDPFKGFDQNEITSHLALLPVEVWENTSATNNKSLKDLMFGKKNLMNTPLIGGRYLLKMVKSLNQFDVQVIKVIKDGKQVLEMEDPFKDLNDDGLRAVNEKVWDFIAKLLTLNDNAKILKTANIKEDEVKKALRDDFTFVTNFGNATSGLSTTLLRKLDKDDVTLLKDHLNNYSIDKFKGSVIADVGPPTDEDDKKRLSYLIKASYYKMKELEVFVIEFCGEFDDFRKMKEKFSFLEEINETCFSQFKKPLASIGAAELTDIINTENKILIAKADYFPAGFTAADMTKKIFVSLKDPSLYKYSAGDSFAAQMAVFCGLGDPRYLDANDKIDGLEIGAECRSKIQTPKLFDYSRSIEKNLEKGDSTGNIYHTQMTILSVTEYFAGIDAKHLAKLPENVIKLLTKREHFEEITYTTVVNALTISHSKLFDYVNFVKIPESFYRQFGHNVLDKIKGKLEKEQWLMTSPWNLGLGSNWIGELKLKEVLEDKANMYFLKEYCNRRESVKDIRKTFNGFKMTLDCLLTLKKPLAGLTIGEIAEIEGGKLKLKEEVFCDMSPEKLSKGMFSSIEAQILLGEEPAFIGLCEYAAKDWLDKDGKISEKPVHDSCKAKMIKLVNVLKANIAKTTDKKAKLDFFKTADRNVQEEFLTEPNECVNFENLVDLVEVIGKVTAKCYEKLSGTKRLAGLTSFWGLEKDVFALMTADDVESHELWESASRIQLEGLKGYETAPTTEIYKTHPCSRLTAKEFLEKIASYRRRDFKEICYMRTKFENDCSTFQVSPVLTSFVIFLSITL